MGGRTGGGWCGVGRGYAARVTRIIAGAVGGRTIAVPQRGTRPTSDRVREALFTLLEHHDLLDGARVLDLYAGSGALGLEAASRGATSVDLVEHDHRAAAVCRDNARSLGLAQVRVHETRVASFLARGRAHDVEHQPSTLVFVDPPYDLENERLEPVLAALTDRLDPDGLVVLERSSRTPLPEMPEGLSLWQSRTYGETVLHFLDVTPESDR